MGMWLSYTNGSRITDTKKNSSWVNKSKRHNPSFRPLRNAVCGMRMFSRLAHPHGMLKKRGGGEGKVGLKYLGWDMRKIHIPITSSERKRGESHDQIWNQNDAWGISPGDDDWLFIKLEAVTRFREFPLATSCRWGGWFCILGLFGVFALVYGSGNPKFLQCL